MWQRCARPPLQTGGYNRIPPQTRKRGKDSVTITIRPSGSGSFWTASSYRMYSFTL